MIQQLSIFAPNAKGSMVNITKLVSDAGIDIYNVVTNDSAEFGIVRMLVTEPERACDLLSKEGYMCKLNKVIGVEIPDDVGSLTNLLQNITDCNINIDYLYVSYSRDSKTPLAVLHAPGYAEVEASLVSRGYTIVK
ncbi:MAG: amino acid-binding protein [Eubacterium sp.]|nr:amino acid-binding protein [Eubacterium sp.]